MTLKKKGLLVPFLKTEHDLQGNLEATKWLLKEAVPFKYQDLPQSDLMILIQYHQC